MKHWKHMLIPAIAFSLLSTPTLWAADEEMEEVTPTFQNAAQLERALNLTSSSFTADDMDDAQARAEDEATKQIDGLAKDHADSVVDQISSDHADSVVYQLSSNYAYSEVYKIADKYAEDLGYVKGTQDYKDAYDKAVARATAEGDWENAWETAYNKAYSRATADGDWENAWETAFNKAYSRATAEGDWENAWETAYNYAIERATSEDFSNAYQAAYKKALAQEVANITGKTLQDIYEMRYVEKLGWGVITKKRLRLEAYHNGKGNRWKHRVGPSIDDVNIPSGPDDPDVFPLEEEIAEATQINLRTGWIDEQEFKTKGNKNKGSKKTYGLTKTSGLAGEDVRGNSKGNNGNGKNISSVGSSSKKGSSTDNQTAASGKTKSNNGNSGGANNSSSNNVNNGGNKSNSSSNGNKGGKGNGNGRNK